MSSTSSSEDGSRGFFGANSLSSDCLAMNPILLREESRVKGAFSNMLSFNLTRKV
jgi:hypothetical protein